MISIARPPPITWVTSPEVSVLPGSCCETAGSFHLILPIEHATMSAIDAPSRGGERVSRANRISGVVLGICILANVALAVSCSDLAVPLIKIRICFCLFSLLVFFLSVSSIRQFLSGMSWTHRLVVVALLGGIIWGHFDRRNDYFPFVTWQLFSDARQDDPVVEDEFIGTTRDGKSVRLLVEQLFPSVTWFQIPTDSVVRSHLARVLAERFNSSHADPVERIDLVRASAKLRPALHEIQPHLERVTCCWQSN
jgi:hypothetical protein